MARVFVTGSADGLGKMAARLMVNDGHRVVLHARNGARAKEALAAVPGAETAVAGDLSSIAECPQIAAQVNALGPFDAVIHNAGVGYREPRRIATVDGLPHVFAINTLAPYILTALIRKPKRLVYLRSGLHRSGDPSLKDLTWSARPWSGSRAYADSKLHDLILAFAVARKWPDVLSNALEPGWVATKMGGPGAPDDLNAGAETQVWLATSNDAEAMVSGEYFYHEKRRASEPAARDQKIQDRLITDVWTNFPCTVSRLTSPHATVETHQRKSPTMIAGLRRLPHRCGFVSLRHRNVCRHLVTGVGVDL
jgi:NAD(P)-dependent dehydrogenase (short-subunit alcohol dehydrogenase family)